MLENELTHLIMCSIGRDNPILPIIVNRTGVPVLWSKTLWMRFLQGTRGYRAAERAVLGVFPQYRHIQVILESAERFSSCICSHTKRKTTRWKCIKLPLQADPTGFERAPRNYLGAQ